MTLVRITFPGILLVIFVLLSGCRHDDENGPTIVNISPNEAPAGKIVLISGTNFSGVTSLDNIVEFNGVPASVTTSTNNTLSVRVPVGAKTGKVTVNVKGKGKTQSPTDFTVNDCSTCGFIEKFSLVNFYDYVIEPINATKETYENSATKRGIFFTVNKKIRIKTIGGLFNEKGSYPMELLSANSGVIYTTTISVNDTENFTLETVNANIQLIPGVEYLLRYCGENHNSVYDISRSSGTNAYLQPMEFDDITLTSLYYSYIDNCSQFGSTNAWRGGIIFMRGVVDFTYEIVE